MVQVNFIYGKDAYIPYAVGAIAANAWNDVEIKNEYCLKKMIFMRENIKELVDSMDNPYLVAFSTYVWNMEYNKALAMKIKEVFPDCHILFGGHNVRNDSSEMLDECPYIDFLVHNEGEIPFKNLLLALKNKTPLSEVGNLSYRDENGVSQKTKNIIVKDADSFPSPYLSGIFDELVKDENYSFSAVLETNRGCPFDCAFCDWGGSYKKHVQLFSMERIKAEILWLAENKIEYCFCADANFGILPRDKEITDFFIETKKKYGYPQKLRVNYTKNSDETVFEINKKLDDSNMSKGATLSFQSLDEKVLENIGRKNMTLDTFRYLISLYNKENIPTYSEIILGLPGETYESFCDGLGKLLESGQHSSIQIFTFELLMNCRLGTDYYIDKYKLETTKVPMLLHHSVPDKTDVQEYSYIVTSTSTMNTEMWSKSLLFYHVILGFHCLGPLQFFAMYLFNENKIKYQTFYNDFMSWADENKNTLCFEILQDLKDRVKQILDGSGSFTYVDEKFGKTTWPFEEGIFLKLVYEKERFYNEIYNFIKTYEIDEDISKEILDYQKNMIKIPNKKIFDINLNYDIHEYFSNILVNKYSPLKKQKNTLHIHENIMYDNWIDYATEVVLYGRRGGKHFYLNIEKEILN